MSMHQSGELEKVLESAGVLVPFEEEEAASTEESETVVRQNATGNTGVTNAKEDGKKRDS